MTTRGNLPGATSPFDAACRVNLPNFCSVSGDVPG